MKKILKRAIAFFMAIAMVFTLNWSMAKTVKAATQEEALSWVQSQVGKSLDVDGVNEAQCVDLIQAYYLYLVGYYVSGDGKDYATNTLPSGWSRIQGAVPQPGDVLVYLGNDENPHGHVAIFESTNVTYHQNFANKPRVERITYTYNRLTNPYWGVVRPNFSDTSSSLTTSWGTSCTYTDDNNAIINATISTDQSVQFTTAGAYVWDPSGNLVAQASEGTSVSGYYMNISYNIWGELGTCLTPGTTYTYQFWAETGGNRYYSNIASFTTTGDSVPPTISNVRITNVNNKGYTVTCTVTDNVGVAKVQFPTWRADRTSEGCIWYEGVQNGNEWSVTLADADGEEYYNTHIYAWDWAGNRTNVDAGLTFIDWTEPVISDVSVSNISSEGYTVTCVATDNTEIDRVQFPTWTVANGQDDIDQEWATSSAARGSRNGNVWTFYVKRSDHNGEYGDYRTHIYAYDIYGNNIHYKVDDICVAEEIPADSIELSETSLQMTVGQTALLDAVISPENATNVQISWSSSNGAVAEVSDSGEITAIGLGIAEITAELANGEKAVCTVTVNAAGTCGEHLEWTLSPDGNLVITGTGEMEDYTRSNEVPWYEYRENIFSVSLSFGVSSISSFAFYDCSSLAAVQIPDSVTEIGASSFYQCTSLKEVILPAELAIIDVGVFSGCSSLEYIELPKKVETIGTYAFRDCASLKNLVLSENLMGIGYAAFANCSALESISIPETVNYIRTYAFSGCDSLRTVYFYTPICCFQDWKEGKDTLEVIGNDNILPVDTVIYGYTDSTAQFYAELNDRTFVSLGNKTRELTGMCGEHVSWTLNAKGELVISGEGSMYDYSYPDHAPWDPNLASMIKTIIIDEGVTGIGNSAFADCTSLENITIADTVESIGDAAFIRCTSLSAVSLPEGLNRVESGAFLFCTSLEKIVFNHPECVIETSGSGSGWIPVNTVIYGYSGSTAQLYAETYGNPFVALAEVAGDVDGDGVVTIFDAGSIIDMVYGRAEINLALGDVDGDGAVTIFDAGMIIDMVYGRA